MTTTELRINRDITVAASAEGLTISLKFITGTNTIRPIELSRAEAIKVGGDITKTGSSDLIPIRFTSEDAAVFGPWLMRFAADA